MGLPSHENRQARVAVYVRHRPETTLLYQIIREYWPEFQAELASQDKYLPAYIGQDVPVPCSTRTCGSGRYTRI